MTTSRYTAEIDSANPNRVIVTDWQGSDHTVVEFTPGMDQWIVDAAQRFLDAGVARFGSVDAFDAACLRYSRLMKLADGVSA